MTYAFTQDLPIRKELWTEIRKALGETPPVGLIAHIVVEKPDGLLRYIDVWESEAQCNAFLDGRVHPVLEGIFSRAGFKPAGEPPKDPLTVVDAWIPSAVAAL